MKVTICGKGGCGKSTITTLPEENLTKRGKQFFNETWEIKDIPEGYYTQRDGMKLVVSGKIHQANEGCACYAGVRHKLLGDEIVNFDKKLKMLLDEE